MLGLDGGEEEKGNEEKCKDGEGGVEVEAKDAVGQSSVTSSFFSLSVFSFVVSLLCLPSLPTPSVYMCMEGGGCECLWEEFLREAVLFLDRERDSVPRSLDLDLERERDFASFFVLCLDLDLPLSFERLLERDFRFPSLLCLLCRLCFSLLFSLSLISDLPSLPSLLSLSFCMLSRLSPLHLRPRLSLCLLRSR